MKKHKISAAIITYNEEESIARTLEKLHWCDEIVILDSNSTDTTVEICKSYNAKVFFKKFNGFGEQKRAMTEKCSHDWILSLDADEVLTDKLIDEIKQEFSKETLPYKAYCLNRRHVYLGKTFKYGNLKNKPILRLFNKHEASFSNRKVHETVVYNGKKGRFKNFFLHYTAKTIEEVNIKKNNYATLISEEYHDKHKTANLFLLFFKYPFTFFKEYILRGNILNGREGYIWSIYMAEYSYLKYFKLIERKRASKS